MIDRDVEESLYLPRMQVDRENPVSSSEDVATFGVFETFWGALHPIVRLGTIFGSVLDISATDYIVRVPEGAVFDEELDPNHEVALIYPVILTSDSDWDVALNALPPPGYEVVNPFQVVEVSEGEPKVGVIGYRAVGE